MMTEEDSSLTPYEEAKFIVLTAFNKVWQLPFEEQKLLLDELAKAISTRIAVVEFGMQPGTRAEIISDK